jgi:hypothetical protein
MKRKEKTFTEKTLLLAWCDTLLQSPELRIKRAANKIKGLAFEITTAVEVMGITKFLNDVIAAKDVDLINYCRTQETFKRFFGHNGNVCAACKKESFINLDGSKSVVKTTNEDMQCKEAIEQIQRLRAKVASEK